MKIACVLSEYSDQPAHPRSLIWVFAEHPIGSKGSKASSYGQRRLISLRNPLGALAIFYAVPRLIFKTVSVSKVKYWRQFSEFLLFFVVLVILQQPIPSRWSKRIVYHETLRAKEEIQSALVFKFSDADLLKLIYSRSLMARTSLKPWKFLDMDSLSHWGFIIAPGQEANWDN